MLWARQLFTMRGFRPIAMLLTMYPAVLKSVATVGGPGNPNQVQPTSMAMSLAVKPMRLSSSCAALWSKQMSGGYQYS